MFKLKPLPLYLGPFSFLLSQNRPSPLFPLLLFFLFFSLRNPARLAQPIDPHRPSFRLPSPSLSVVRGPTFRARPLTLARAAPSARRISRAFAFLSLALMARLNAPIQSYSSLPSLPQPQPRLQQWQRPIKPPLPHSWPLRP